ncbi:POT-type proton-dependent oligopeptide transporter [Pseudoduganella namucuonensis]|uniref:Proton-dependent oligopeptide transporter, POT family n=1 Tax=Pseudoduganella namucuonensis TaxID=1035707 RepID=A0A1I7FIJ6_9BURK|nr:oligopeptide:H+ symporter [Pseudoduganella namucuonensis]SFU35994.1 proton-dependent oligopeptide transporter, POT family [Pseudoduganella namucuonensis]
MANPHTETEAGNGPMPRQVPFIIANEACERFSFYGMRNILTPFLISTLLLFVPQPDRASEAKHVFHTFVIGVYFFPLLGGWLSDRFYGKYNTIFWMSLIYVAGHACLAVFEDNLQGFYLGLLLIALGAGGIKPLVSAFVGDQFDATNKKKAKVVYDIFYWTINFGSFFASLLMPLFLKNYGPAVAFGIPGVLMAIATVIFWSGKKRYVHIPPAPPNPDSFTNVARTALLARQPGQSRPGLTVAVVGALGALASLCMSPWWGFVIAACLALVLLLAFGGIGTGMQLERARGLHPDAAVEGVRAVLRILIVFALVTPFWSLFDQKASTWILQANNMVSPQLSLFGFEFKVLPAQMQAVNPLLVMLLIPLNNLVIFPLLRGIGIEPTPLRRMTTGIALSGLSWIIIGWIQLSMDAGTPMSILWQLLPYAVLTMAEVLVSATGLEFAYSQAPPSMKGSIMSFWILTTTVGNLWVLIVNSSVKNEAVLAHIATSGMSSIAFQMFFFAGFALLTAVVFGMYAVRYKMVDNYRKEVIR